MHLRKVHALIFKKKIVTDLCPPMCIGCDKRLTIEHILLTGSDCIEIRESHFTAKSLRRLFQDISPEKIFNFLKEINIFRKINKLRSFLVMFVLSTF